MDNLVAKLFSFDFLAGFSLNLIFNAAVGSLCGCDCYFVLGVEALLQYNGKSTHKRESSQSEAVCWLSGVILGSKKITE